MELIKVGGAVGANGMLAMAQAMADVPPITDTLLVVAQIGVAVLTIVYIGTKIWNLWRGKK